MYLKRKDGTCGKIFPATDSCFVYQSGVSFYDYNEKTNEPFWKLFGIKDINKFFGGDAFRFHNLRKEKEEIWKGILLWM